MSTFFKFAEKLLDYIKWHNAILKEGELYMSNANQEPKKPVVYVKLGKLTGGEIYEGTFTGTHESPSLFDDGKIMSTHYIEADDTVYGINGAAQLNALMKKRVKGQRVTIEYTGKETIKRKNGQMAETHSCNVIDS